MTGHRIAALTIALALAGCAATPAGESARRAIAQDLDAAAAARPAPLVIPGEVQQALLPSFRAQMPRAETAPLDARFDLNANNAAAREVFLSLIEDTPYSMAVPPEVTQRITVNLKNVTVPEALDIIRQMYGYDYQRIGNRYYILGAKLHTRLFPVNYLDLNRRGQSSLQVNSSELRSGGGGAANRAGGAAASAGSGAGIKVQTDTQLDFWHQLEDTIKALVGLEAGRRVVINAPAGLVVVRAMPDELRLVEEFLGITQEAVNRQVILEAKILEVELSDRFQAGINWAGLGGTGGVDALATQTGGGTLLNGGDISDIGGNSGNLFPGASGFNPIGAANASAFGGIFTLTLRADNFAAFIELLQSQGQVHVLSSPRVSTVNNQKAVIKVGGDEFFVTGVTNNTTSEGATTTQSPTVELTPFFSGIALDVTPQIDDLNNIVLHIHPTVSEVAQKNKTFIIGDQNYSVPLAFSTIQESDNVVRSPSGQIIVIGGLMKEQSSDSQARVPVLGDLPLVGRLFRHTRVTRVKKELVILLKPSIVNAAQNWQQELHNSGERIKHLKKVVRP